MVKKISLKTQKIIDESNRVPEPEVIAEEVPVKKVRQKRAMRIKVENPVEEPVEEKVEHSEKPVEKPVKKKRAPSAYNLFVKETIPKLSHIPPKERFAEVSKLWKKHKDKK
jgi:hypothetical protein